MPNVATKDKEDISVKKQTKMKLEDLSIPPDYERDQEWLDSHIEYLSEKYQNKWVAILNESVVAYGNNYEEVEKETTKHYPDSRPIYWLIEDVICESD